MDTTYRLHQNIELDAPVEYANVSRAKSKFWNEGKWDTFVKPFLPPSEDCKEMTFIEIGCATGLYLKMAKEYGFRNVLGVEGDKTTYEYALKYRKFNGLDYKLWFKFVGIDFKPEDLPVADYVLIANAHYYFDINSWVHLIDNMKLKVRNCIIVSRKLRKHAPWRPSPDYERVKSNFGAWAELGFIHDIPFGRDPNPRLGMYSLLLNSGLERTQINNIYPVDYKESAMVSATREFACSIANTLREEFVPTKTRYYKYTKWRMRNRWSKEESIAYVTGKADLMYDIKENGVKYPLIIGDCNRLRDGGHRWAMLQALGYTTAITRFV
jgi:SAM-dependent methyltransferase